MLRNINDIPKQYKLEEKLGRLRDINRRLSIITRPELIEEKVATSSTLSLERLVALLREKKTVVDEMISLDAQPRPRDLTLRAKVENDIALIEEELRQRSKESSPAESEPPADSGTPRPRIIRTTSKRQQTPAGNRSSFVAPSQTTKTGTDRPTADDGQREGDPAQRDTTTRQRGSANADSEKKKPQEPRSSVFADIVAAVSSGAAAVADGGRTVFNTLASPFRATEEKKTPKPTKPTRSWADRLRATVGVKTPMMVPENPEFLSTLNAAAAKVDRSEIWAKELCVAMAGTYGFVTKADTLYKTTEKREKPEIVATFTRPMAVDMLNWLAGTGISETPAKSFVRIKQVSSTRPFDMAKTIMARQSARKEASAPPLPVIDMTRVALLTGKPVFGGIFASLYTLVVVSNTDAYDITVDIRKDMNEAFVIATNTCNKTLQLNGLFNVGASYGITRNAFEAPAKTVVATDPGSIVTPDMITRTTNVYRDTAVDLPDVSMADFDIPMSKRRQFLELVTNMATFTVIANQDLTFTTVRLNNRPRFADLSAKTDRDTFAFIVNSLGDRIYTNSSRALEDAAHEITEQAKQLGIRLATP